jgi:PST family polysaccharide transporter
MSQNLFSKSISGSVYNIGVSVVTMVLGFIRVTLLMRLLPDPDSFGIISLSLFFTTMAIPFSVLGLDSGLIQKKDPTPDAFSTHFILRMGLSITLFLVGLAVSPLLRRLYPTRFIMVDFFIIFLVINVLNASYSTQGVILRRDLQFRSIALLNLSASISMTIIAPLAAYLGAGIWSLFLEQAVGTIVRWLGLWILIRPWKPTIEFNYQEVVASIRFGSKVLSSNLLGILLDRFDDFWAGTFLGSAVLGYYSRAYDLVQYPERILATPVTNVFFSMYAALQDNKLNLSKAFFRSNSFLVRVGFLIGVILFFISPEITIILYTGVWLPIVPVFRIMLFYLILNPLYVNLSFLMIGIGKPDLLVQTRLIQVVVFIICVVGLAYTSGVNGIALATNIMMLIGTIRLLVFSRNFVQISYKRMLFWPVIAFITSLSVGGLTIQNLDIDNLWMSLIIKIFVVSAIYLPILLAAEHDIIFDFGGSLVMPIWNKVKIEFSQIIRRMS